ncbi:MAG: 30S ribosomal protein S12 methylthiotransferase RimO [Bacteroidota bacterium]|nr:30S ribosomal protein S12 methylthiotransferase RimO [Bacteroidota bacterium]
MKTKKKTERIGIVSLGCAKNLVDTEVLMRQLDENSFQLITDPSGAETLDAAVINTCGFILDAKNESIDTILDFVKMKKEGRLKKLFVIGCLSERYKNELANEIPEVDGFFGVNELPVILQSLGSQYRKELLGERHLTTPGHYAYLKIAEGCDRKCSFCSIPSIRGSHVSRPMEDILHEAEFLAKKGVREINVISQDTTFYGQDLYQKRLLPELLQNLSCIKGIEWIRLHYTYPDGFSPELMKVMRENDKICKYVDIPLQHISARILKSMKRGVGSRKTWNLIASIRKNIPGVAIRSALITGYPGETHQEHLELCDFVRKARFDRLGVFTYSHEEGTTAYQLKDSVSGSLKKKRASELMDIQQEISLELNQKKIGEKQKVIIDRKENEFYIGRTQYDSPEIDDEVLIRTAKTLSIGSFYDVKITAAENFDLYGEIH